MPNVNSEKEQKYETERIGNARKSWGRANVTKRSKSLQVTRKKKFSIADDNNLNGNHLVGTQYARVATHVVIGTRNVVNVVIFLFYFIFFEQVVAVPRQRILPLVENKLYAFEPKRVYVPLESDYSGFSLPV